MHCGFASQHQVTAPLADDFVDACHGHAHVAEAAGSYQIAVVDEARYRFCDGGLLVVQVAGLVFEHPLPVLIRIVPANQLTLAFLQNLHGMPPQGGLQRPEGIISSGRSSSCDVNGDQNSG